MLNSSANDRNPVLPIIPVIDEALGRLRYFPIGPRRGLPHSSEIGFGESASGQSRCFGRSGSMSAIAPIATVPAPCRNGREGPTSDILAGLKARRLRHS